MHVTGSPTAQSVFGVVKGGGSEAGFSVDLSP